MASAQRPRAQKRFLAEAPQLVIAGRTRHSMVDTPDDDGIAAHFRPQLGNARQAQNTLRLRQRAAKAERNHDQLVATGTRAFPP